MERLAVIFEGIVIWVIRIFTVCFTGTLLYAGWLLPHSGIFILEALTVMAMILLAVGAIIFERVLESMIRDI